MQEAVTNYKMYIELREILKHTEASVVKKIPKAFLKKLDSVDANGYEFKYDVSKPLKEQKILTLTKELLAGLYIKYCCSEEEAKQLTQKCVANDSIANKDFGINWKRNSNNSQQKTQVDNNQQIQEQEEVTDVAVYQKHGFFFNLINKIKNFFRR